jgi:hypothetical protein
MSLRWQSVCERKKKNGKRYAGGHQTASNIGPAVHAGADPMRL